MYHNADLIMKEYEKRKKGNYSPLDYFFLVAFFLNLSLNLLLTPSTMVIVPIIKYPDSFSIILQVNIIIILTRMFFHAE